MQGRFVGEGLHKLGYLCSPNIIALEVPTDALIAMVGVDTTCTLWLSLSPIVLAYLLRFIVPTTTANVLTIAIAEPLSRCTNIGEYEPTTIIEHGHNLLTTSACRVWSPILVSMQVEILPTFGATLLSTFAHVVAPLLALVRRDMTFEELPVLLVDTRPDGRNV